MRTILIDKLLNKKVTSHTKNIIALLNRTKLHVEDFDDVKTGYRISFSFKENPYFENDVLTKEFHLGAENQSDNFSQTSTATQIKWKEGKDLLKELQSKPQTNKKRDADHKSFFEWFLDTHVRLLLPIYFKI